jgi:arabinose-5-phosphate isomerase
MSDLDVVGIGSMVLDRVHRAPRLLGSESKGILRDVGGAGPVRSFVGGVTLNHLGWAAALGLRTGVFGRQGDDADGAFLRSAMQVAGMQRDLTLVAAATSVAEIFVDDEGGRAIYMAPGATAETTAAHVREDHARTILSAARLTTEVSQLPLAAALAALEIAGDAGIPTVVDLDVPPSEAVPGLGSPAELEAVLQRADLLKPAKSAAAELVPEAGSDVLAVARAMRARFGNTSVVVTDGAAGCAVASDGFEGRVPGFGVDVVDTTGAGDALLGGLLVGLQHGLDWQSAARLGNACGAACVQKLGAFPDDAAAARQRVLELYDGAALSLAEAAPDAADVTSALAAYEIAVEELGELGSRLAPEMFDAALVLLAEARARGGRLHVTGVGKPEHVAHYAASLFSSTGTPASFLHATEAVHGSAGQVVAGDVVIAISNSGETRELLATVALVKRLGARLIAVTGGLASPLADAADAVLDAGVKREGGPLGLAPRASVAAELLVLASLAAAGQQQQGFTRRDYHRRHPSGKLGALSSEEG